MNPLRRIRHVWPVNKVPVTQPIIEQFILFGDSITEHASSQEHGYAFAPALQQAYIRRLDVVNRGFSGYNTTQALKVLSSIVPAPAQAKVRFMVEMIFFGANDACSVEASNGQHVPLETYKLNLRDIVTHPVVQAHEPRIILVTPPAVEERLLEQRVKSFGYKELNRSNAVTKLYADAVHEVGKANNIAVLDLWSAFMTEAGWKAGDPLPGSLSVPKNAGLRRLLVDGLHFNPDGYRILYAELMKLIEKRWPEQIPETLSYVLPAWDDRLEWAKEGLQMGQPDVAIHE